MKKLLSLCLLSMATATMSAQTLTADPASGSVVESLNSVVLTLSDEEGYDLIDINSKDDIFFSLNGERFCGAKCTSVEDNILEVTPQDAIVKPGEYSLVISAYAISFANYSYSKYVDNEEDLIFNYTIEGDPNAMPEFEVTLSPAAGTVASLSEILMEIDTEVFADIDVDVADGINVYKDGELFSAVKVKDAESHVTLTLETPATEDGVYELVVDPYVIALYLANPVDDNNCVYNEEELRYTYNMHVMEPVAYDVVPTRYKPSAGELDLDMIQFESITLTVPKGVTAREGAAFYLIPVGYDDEVQELTNVKNIPTMNQIVVFLNKTPQYNGEYEFFIPEGTIGDADWNSDNQYGHTNGEISVIYNIIGGKDRDGATFDVVPEVTYPETLDSVTLEFEDGIHMSEGAFASLLCEEAKYAQSAYFVENENGTFTATFDVAPSEVGKYTLVIEQGCFGNNAYLENKTTGRANEAVSMVIEFTGTVGIDSVDAEKAAAGVYNMLGVKVADSAEGLPAGLYIVDGKKVIVK